MSSSRRPSWLAGELGAAAELSQGDAGGVADDVARTGTQSGGLGD
jgi:hypothetical protein